ncbi:MAG: ArsR/SmtB family transcription factor [Myxococcales bacterium]
MPTRKLVAEELAEMLGVLAHPLRVRLVQELRDGEHDVNDLVHRVEAAQSNVSQQLALLRTHRIVGQRREGRHVFYRLLHPELASWLTGGLQFLQDAVEERAQVKHAIDEVRAIWTDSEES